MASDCDSVFIMVCMGSISNRIKDQIKEERNMNREKINDMKLKI